MNQKPIEPLFVPPPGAGPEPDTKREPPSSKLTQKDEADEALERANQAVIQTMEWWGRITANKRFEQKY